MEEHNEDENSKDSEIKTELKERNGHTEHEIIKGWWMGGDFMVFLTKSQKQKKHNIGYGYYLELFKFGELDQKDRKPIDSIEIFRSSEVIKFSDHITSSY